MAGFKFMYSAVSVPQIDGGAANRSWFVNDVLEKETKVDLASGLFEFLFRR